MTGQQLKNSILQMAVQGKLVPQDPNDEPASVLLERIRKEKEQLIKDGKIKKEKNPSYIFRGADNLPYEKVGKNEPVCIADEVPFDIPDSWEWVRLSTANDMYTGNSINENEKKQKYSGLSDGYFYIGTKDVGFDHTINYDNGVRIPYDNEKFRIAPQNSILLCVEGGSAGRKISFTNQDVCFGNKLCCFVSFGVDYKFLYYYLQSPLFQSAFKENTTGIIGGVSVNTLKSMFLPIPPLNEQLRIVKEITKLEPFIDGYRIAEENLAKLNQTFPDLLKKSILQEAVQGKLVPQYSNDEPASVLLERIRAEKQRLIKEGKIKKDKHESVIFRRDNSHYEKLDGIERCIDDEIPFEIPDTWEWVRLSNVFSVINGDRGKNYPAKSTLSKTGIPFISALNLDGKTVVEDDNLLCLSDEQFNKLGNGKLEKDDVVVCIRGSLGKHGRYPFEKGAIASSLVILRPHMNIPLLSDFIMMYLDSPVFFSEIKKYDNGTAQPNLAAKSLEMFFVPLPPIE